MSLFDDILGDGRERPPAPEVADTEDVERYNIEFMKAHGMEPRTGGSDVDPEESPFAKQDKDADRARQSTNHKAQFPWLFDPSRGVRWDFNPIQLRNLAQTNTWVGMLVQTISKEIAETPWTIVEADGRSETQKRLSTHPDERDTLAKDMSELPDADAERIHDLLMRPNPDDTWQDMVEMWMGDLLEIGSLATVKAFHRNAYGEDDELTADPRNIEPRALVPSAPEVWTKDYHEKTSLVEGYWQFDDHRSPGSGSTDGNTTSHRAGGSPDFFDEAEMVWADMTPRTNRRYGIPPTLLVEDFLESLDLAITQEQQYLSRGSIPSGAWVFEQWDREQLKERKEEMEQNVKGKPHKSLMFAGQGGDVSFEPMSMNFQELEFTERMKWYARVVASAFQVPTAVVGIEPERVNYNTFQGERENFESNTLGPYLQKLERIINMDIIRPHWGAGEYRFEFKPGMSESTRQMISERVTREFESGLRRRNEARREVGLDEVDEEFDGFQDEVVEDTSPEDGLGDMLASATAKDADSEGFAADVFRVHLPDDHDREGFDDDMVGMGVDFPNDSVYVDWRNEVFPDALDNSHVSIYGTVEDLEQATGNETEVLDTLDATREAEVAASVVKSVTEADSGNGNEGDVLDDWDGVGPYVEKDEPLRETDEWYQFDVQPHMVEDLEDEIADDVRALFDEVRSDDEVMSIIERLAVEDTEEKSLSALSRRLREVFESSDVVARIESALREETTDAVTSTLEETMSEASAGDVETDVDVEAIRSQLEERSVEFADSFANEMQDDILDTVGEGWESGAGTQEIADEIAEQADINEGWNGAERIARQEMHVATGKAREEVAAELDKVRVWRTSGDNRVRDAHREMDGKWVRAGESWEVAYEDGTVVKEDVPGNSEYGIGCRCTDLLRDREEVDRSDYGGEGSID